MKVAIILAKEVLAVLIRNKYPSSLPNPQILIILTVEEVTTQEIREAMLNRSIDVVDRHLSLSCPKIST